MKLSAKTRLQYYYYAINSIGLELYSIYSILSLHTIKLEELGMTDLSVFTSNVQVAFCTERQKQHLTILITRFIDEPWVVCKGSINVSHFSCERRVEFTSSFHTFQCPELI